MVIIEDGQNTSSGGGSGAVDSVNGKTGTVVLDKSDIGLGNVDNTKDTDKPVSTPQKTYIDGADNQLAQAITDEETNRQNADNDLYKYIDSRYIYLIEEYFDRFSDWNWLWWNYDNSGGNANWRHDNGSDGIRFLQADGNSADVTLDNSNYRLSHFYNRYFFHFGDKNGNNGGSQQLYYRFHFSDGGDGYELQMDFNETAGTLTFMLSKLVTWSAVSSKNLGSISMATAQKFKVELVAEGNTFVDIYIDDILLVENAGDTHTIETLDFKWGYVALNWMPDDGTAQRAWILDEYILKTKIEGGK